MNLHNSMIIKEVLETTSSSTLDDLANEINQALYNDEFIKNIKEDVQKAYNALFLLQANLDNIKIDEISLNSIRSNILKINSTMDLIEKKGKNNEI